MYMNEMVCTCLDIAFDIQQRMICFLGAFIPDFKEWWLNTVYVGNVINDQKLILCMIYSRSYDGSCHFKPLWAELPVK